MTGPIADVDRWNGLWEMRGMLVPLDSLTLDPDNARLHRDDDIAALARVLAEFGQTKPIVIDDRNMVLAGNGTVQAARSIGWKSIAAVPYSGAREDTVGYQIADNRTAELSTWDVEATATYLGTLDDADLASTVWTPGAVAELQRQADELASPAEEPAPRTVITVLLDGEQARATWQGFLGALASAYPEIGHPSDRIIRHLAETGEGMARVAP